MVFNHEHLLCRKKVNNIAARVCLIQSEQLEKESGADKKHPLTKFWERIGAKCIEIVLKWNGNRNCTKYLMATIDGHHLYQVKPGLAKPQLKLIDSLDKLVNFLNEIGH